MEKRYLHQWLKINFKKVNEQWEQPPRLLGKNGILEAEQQQFLQLGQHMATRMEWAIAEGNKDFAKPIEFAILRSEELGAWAFWASKCYGIVVTQGLIENMQAVCGQVPRLMRAAIDTQPSEDNFVRNLWADMPNGNFDFMSYGEVLAQIAFDFIVHHELAHAGLGHEWVMATAPASEALHALSDEERFWTIDEVSLGATSSGGSGVNSWKQALEADADLNGLRYTIEYLEMQAKMFSTKGKLSKEHRDIVWETVLTNDRLRWFAILTGACIALAALLSRPRSQIGELAASTHPPLPARMLMVLHAGIQLQSQAMPQNRINASDVLLLVSGLFGMLHSARALHIKKLDAMLKEFNLPEAVQRYGEIGEHFSKLAKQMSQLDSRRNHCRRFPDSLRWDWYGTSSQSKTAHVIN